MANGEHDYILSQGVQVWNKWREDKPEIAVDLQNADLRGADLMEADFSAADLEGANFRRANLKKASFIKANLIRASLVEANLQNACLIETNLEEANLEYASLEDADLQDSFCLRANFMNTMLLGTKFIGANFGQALLLNAFFHHANLVEINLSEANITGTKLYGTSRDNWKIDGIKCDYVYFDSHDKERTPKDRDFRPGEFEELYKSLPTIEYIFENGFTPIDPIIMNQVVTAINEKHPEFELQLDSFHSRGIPHAKFTVLHKENADKALEQISQKYEQEIKYLEGQRDYANQMMMQVLEKIKTGDNITINAKRDVTFSKDNAKAITMKDSQAGIVSDEAKVNGDIDLNKQQPHK